jgi:hypothetical protein
LSPRRGASRRAANEQTPADITDPGHQADAAASHRLRLQSDKAPEALFIQNRGQLPIALSCGACLRRSNHSETLCREIPPWESRSTNSSRSVAIMTQLFMDEPLGDSITASTQIRFSVHTGVPAEVEFYKAGMSVMGG